MNNVFPIKDEVTDAGERTPRVLLRERILLAALTGAGIFGLLFFWEYWCAHDHRRAPAFFWLLTFAVFWQPLRDVYNWRVYLWAENPESRCPLSLRCLNETAMRVDVITTAMPGEPFAMLQSTLVAIAALTNLNQAFLMDGEDDSKLKALCYRLGISHVDCREIGGAKAGKINHCLRELSRAELVLVIDPDHIPKREFIDRVSSWFNDPRVGFVQVVRAYYNVRDNWVAWGAAGQTFGFYGPTLMGLHGPGLPTAIGANCTFRRTALDSVGGHAEHLAEDALTSMRLHAQGWSSVYLPWRGSERLVPTDLSFWKQQLKWATGMTYILFQHHIVTLFSQEGARNVAFVWTPYTSDDIAAWPGGDFVDWVGVDIFNNGTSLETRHLQRLSNV